VITLAAALAAGLLAHAASDALPQRDYAEPPSGLELDRQLWGDLRAATNDAVTHLARIAQCSFRIQYGGYYQRLDLGAKGAAGADMASRRQALSSAAAAADESQLPPPRDPSIRECRGVLVELDTLIPLHADPKLAPRLGATRAEARRCIDAIRPFADRVEARAAALEAALAEVDRLVPGPPPGAASPAAPRDAGAGTAPAATP
jgi:hypothetical protein